MSQYEDHHSGRGWKIAAASVFGVLLVSWGVIMLMFQKTIESNEVGVFQYRPYLVGSSSIDKQVIEGPNRAYMWPSTTLWNINTAPQTITAHAEDFMTKDRVPLDFDIAITIRVTGPAKAPDLVQKFGSGPITAFRTLVLQEGEGTKKTPTGEFMSFLRDQVRHHHSAVFIAAQNEDGTLSEQAANVENATREHINAFLNKNSAGMIEVVNIALGRANPPDGVRRTIEATAQQAQEIKTQQERKRAADARALAEVAVAAADNAYLNAMNFSSDQFVQLRKIEMQREVCRTNTCLFSDGQMPLAFTPPAQKATIPVSTAAKQ